MLDLSQSWSQRCCVSGHAKEAVKPVMQHDHKAPSDKTIGSLADRSVKGKHPVTRDGRNWLAQPKASAELLGRPCT